MSLEPLLCKITDENKWKADIRIQLIVFLNHINVICRTLSFSTSFKSCLRTMIIRASGIFHIKQNHFKLTSAALNAHVREVMYSEANSTLHSAL